MSAPRQALARAPSNIALVKYWGKRDAELNLPAVGSLSITLDGLWTETQVCFQPQSHTDTFTLNGRAEPSKQARVSAALNLLCDIAQVDWCASVDSHNNFPTGAGLASSASGFAALVVAGAAALDLHLTPFELSVLARRCSGSAARSIFGGFVEWKRGELGDGSDSHAIPLIAPAEWPLRVVVAMTSQAEKPVGSTVGMNRSFCSSPFTTSWIEEQDADLDGARTAVLNHDFEALAEVSEHSCLKMHALAMTARPALLYWNAATVDCIQRARELRASGVAAFFTIDAGPQVKVICEPAVAVRVATALREIPGVVEVIECGLGDGASLLPLRTAACA
ncbi:MAG: diphosphomevalonate decarboxylase [Panacagrimonas sp.]